MLSQIILFSGSKSLKNSSTVPLDPRVSCFTCSCTVQSSSLTDWNISDALWDERNANTSVEWKAGEFPLTSWSTRQRLGLILLYTDLTQQLLSSGVINTKVWGLSPHPVHPVWPYGRRQPWKDILTVAETDRHIKSRHKDPRR